MINQSKRRMYDIPEDCLLTYDPDYVDLHANSTDFEDSHIVRVAPKGGNHSLFSKKKTYKQSSLDRAPENVVLYNMEMSKSSSKVLYETEMMYNNTNRDSELFKSYRNRKSNLLHGDNEIQIKRSIRHKIIPSISNIIKKSSNLITSNSAIKRSKAENGSQTNRASREPKASKLHRRQQYYAVQPVYAIERNMYAQTSPFKEIKRNRAALPTQKSSRDEYYNTVCSLTSSSEGDHRLRQIIETRSKWSKKVDSNTQKGFRDGNFSRQHQKPEWQESNPVKQHRKFPFQVYTNPLQCTTGMMASSDISSTTSAVPSTCSGFWDYLFNKINNKYQKVQVYKSCKCCTTEKQLKTSPCCNPSCNPPCCNVCDAATEQPNAYYNNAKTTCSCNTSAEKIPLETPQPTTTAPTAKLHIAPKSQRQPAETDPNQLMLQPKESPGEIYIEKPRCQMKHNELTTALNQKYNGEILCIHNPPCIVINGCLNLPPIDQNQNKSTPTWSVTEFSKPSYQNVYRSKRSKKKKKEERLETAFDRDQRIHVVERSSQWNNYEIKQQVDKSVKMERNIVDRSCQYLPQTVDQFQLTELATEEKNIQSYCNHVPPCEVKRKCHKPKYGPILNSNCYHVPMCESIPVCILDSIDTIHPKVTCRHKPKCVEVPKCSIDYLVMNAKGETGTQVRPKNKMVCRHDPPCILIPKCLAQMCSEGCMVQDAIPSCVHQPRCEMIPACCRKSTKEMMCCRKSVKEMVSVCSQHPNSCRIV